MSSLHHSALQLQKGEITDDGDKELTDSQMKDILYNFFDWHIDYLRAVSMGDTRLYQQMERDFDAEKMVYDVTRGTCLPSTQKGENE